jgi:hypothetical protein
MDQSDVKAKLRHVDETGKWIEKFDPPIQFFAKQILLRCKTCRRCAVVRSDEYDETERVFVTESSCSQCGNIRTIRTKRLKGSYLELPLWLQTRCCGEVLWALNEEHLRYLETYLGARMRTRAFGQNSTIAARLPKWMTAAKNRQAVEKGLGRLRKMLLAG